MTETDKELSEMKILHLTLKKKWFDMIASGEKKEEYREIKPYWEKRFNYMHGKLFGKPISLPLKSFDLIKFTNGYSKNAPYFFIQCARITVGEAKPEWSDNWQEEVFIIKLGEIIK